jgi:hypothetical protein
MHFLTLTCPASILYTQVNRYEVVIEDSEVSARYHVGQAPDPVWVARLSIGFECSLPTVNTNVASCTKATDNSSNNSVTHGMQIPLFYRLHFAFHALLGMREEMFIPLGVVYRREVHLTQ